MTPTSDHTVVIADDHMITRNGLRGLLEALGNFRVVAEAEDGLEAISTIKRLQPDLAILDLKMPHSNGAEAFLEIRRWSPGTRVVMLTGLSAPALFRELRDGGVNGLFLKTGDVEELKAALPSILAGHSVVSEAVSSAIAQAGESPTLTRRELQVLQGIARAETNAAIAQRLGISPKTVDTHRTNLMAKLDVHSAAELLTQALRCGLIEAPDAV